MRRAEGSYMPLRIGLVALAFFIYGLAVLSLHQDRTSRWFVEANFSLPAAISYTAYGTPLGMSDAKIYKAFQNVSRHPSDNLISVQEALARASGGDLPVGELLQVSTDGNGAGYPIFASLALEAFGPRLSSLTYAFLLLMALSTLLFAMRFHDERLFTVPLLFFALTLMLLSPFGFAPKVINEAPIGGLRYFSVAAILPAFHILFEVNDRRRLDVVSMARHYAFLGLQACVFALVMLTRGSVGYLLVPVIVAASFGTWMNWQRPNALRQIICKTGFTMLAGMAFIAVIATLVPDYGRTGRLFGNVWHRVFVAFGLHPSWPFGDLSTVYDCRHMVPEGLKPDLVDRNGHCIFYSSFPPAVSAKLSDEEINAGLLGGDYERELRSASLRVLLSFPREVIELYIYHKTAMILWTLRNSLRFDFSAHNSTTLGLVTLQCVVFIAFVAWGAFRGSAEVSSRIAILIPLFVLSLLPLYVAFSYLHTSADTVFFMYAGAVSILGVVIQGIVRQLSGAPKSNIPRFLTVLADFRNKTRAAIAVSICAGLVWISYNSFVFRELSKAIEATSRHVSLAQAPLPRVTDISELPGFPDSSSIPIAAWELIEGLAVTSTKGAAVAPGQRILRLVAAGSNGRHALGVRFENLVPGRRYGAMAWVRADPGARVMIEVRDSLDPQTGQASNYGVARFDLRTRSMIDFSGDILAGGTVAKGGDWLKLWVDLRTSDGTIFVLLGLLDGRNNDHEFNPAGQRVTFGGFAIE
jgi:hypothetical protein